MKRMMLFVVLLSMGAGCVSSMQMPWQKVDKPPAKVEAPPPAPPTVDAKEINEGNAFQEANKISRELDYDEMYRNR
jgi:hypothetical protein